MVLNQPGPVSGSPLRLQELADPVPGPGEIRLRVRLCAACRTDLHIVEGELPPRQGHVVPGHQVVGVVDRLGPGCRRFSLGQRVGVAWLRHTCGLCEFCRSGRENLCEDARFTGYHANGGYADLAVVPEDFAYEIPSAFRDEDAAPLLCAGIIGYRALERCALPRGGTLAIFGFGSSAHVVIQIARHRGCRVLVVTRGERHQRLALELGADWASDSTDGLPSRADSAILFAPVGTLVPPALASLKKGGTLSVAGIHLSDIPPLNYQQHLFQERTLRSVSANTREDGRRLLQEAAEIPIRPRLTFYDLADANRALLDLKEDRVSGTAVLRVS